MKEVIKPKVKTLAVGESFTTKEMNGKKDMFYVR